MPTFMNHVLLLSQIVLGQAAPADAGSAAGVSAPAVPQADVVEPSVQSMPIPKAGQPAADGAPREQGRVIVRVLINANGGVDKAILQRSSGHERLDQSALTAARQARFKPYRVNGVPQPAMVDLPFDFVSGN